MRDFPIRAGTVLEFMGAEITWEMLKTDNGWYVWATHHGETEDDSFKFTASHASLDVAVARVGKQVWKRGPQWIRTFDNRANWRRKKRRA